MDKRTTSIAWRRWLALAGLVGGAALLMGGCGDFGEEGGTTLGEAFDNLGDAVGDVGDAFQNAFDDVF